MRISSQEAMLGFKVKLVKFNQQLAINLAKIQGNVKPKLMKIAVIYLCNVILRTPVKTGRARAGWHIKNKKNAVAVVNRVHYIVYLEAGHSTQAPQGFARLALIEIGQALKDGRLKL